MYDILIMNSFSTFYPGSVADTYLVNIGEYGFEGQWKEPRIFFSVACHGVRLPGTGMSEAEQGY